jgi:hypothetical protein
LYKYHVIYINLTSFPIPYINPVTCFPIQSDNDLMRVFLFNLSCRNLLLDEGGHLKIGDYWVQMLYEQIHPNQDNSMFSPSFHFSFLTILKNYSVYLELYSHLKYKGGTRVYVRGRITAPVIPTSFSTFHLLIINFSCIYM